MTTVTAKTNNDRFLIKAKGHAIGSEQVCAGISAILYELAGYLKNCDAKCDIKLDPGDASIEFDITNKSSVAYDMTVIGLLQIEAGNSDYLKVIVFDPEKD